MWTTSPGTLLTINSFLILLSPEVDLSPEQLVTIKLKRDSRGHRVWKVGVTGFDCRGHRVWKLRTPDLRHQTKTHFYHFIVVSLLFVTLW